MEAIHAEPKSIRELFSHWEFSIPAFQRPYSWKIEQCENLWNDFISFHEEGDKDHPVYFLGSVVLHPASNDKKHWLVIDGQQRLTTLLLLSKAMHDRALTYKMLEKLYKTADQQTGEVNNEVRLCLNEQEGNYRDFQTIMLEGPRSLTEKNKFHENFSKLQEMLDNWHEGKSTSEITAMIDTWMDKVVLLPIQCNSEEHALTIFNTVNDRGMNLNDADIFKGAIYAKIDKIEREMFIKRWNGLTGSDEKESVHEDLFRIYMHILRAREGDTAKEKALRKYMTEHWKDRPTKLSEDWGQLMQTLEICYHIGECDATHEKLYAEETIYWAILNSAPNKYWEPPLYVFLHKHMKKDKREGWVLPEERHAEYLKLLESTVRYFFIKAVVHNSVNAVKDTTYRVCAAIESETDYLTEYKDCIKKHGDIKQFENKLTNSNYGRCQRGLVLINSLCNEKQNRSNCAEEIWDAQIEHILPRKWNDYDGWNDSLHKEHLNILGNLMPLREKSNKAASNEFFSRKQEEYAKSTIQDALDLSVKSDKKWYPQDVQERNAEAIKRLMKFFSK